MMPCTRAQFHFSLGFLCTPVLTRSLRFVGVVHCLSPPTPVGFLRITAAGRASAADIPVPEGHAHAVPRAAGGALLPQLHLSLRGVHPPGVVLRRPVFLHHQTVSNITPVEFCFLVFRWAGRRKHLMWWSRCLRVRRSLALL